jgi:predicted flap endonuclease-1-like 5' DNA nuclease
MELIREYWWVVAIVLALALALAFILLRPKQRVQLTDSTPVRPHMAHAKGPAEGSGIAGEAAAATSDVAGEILHAPVHRALDSGATPADDLSRLKGVGPKFADALRGLGFTRYEQIAALSPTEIDRVDNHLGAFRGRITRDRIVEQAEYLARNDTDGFEQTFGKL